MFCNKCGKEIENGVLCYECAALESQNAAAETKVEEAVVAAEPELKAEAPKSVEQNNAQPTAPASNGQYGYQQYDYQQRNGYQQYGYQPQYGYGQNNFQQQNAYQQQDAFVNDQPGIPEPENKMFGFGKALTSAILGSVAVFGAAIAFYSVFFEFYFAALYGQDFNFLASLGSGMGNTAVIAMIVVAVIFGITSIKTFIARKKANCAKPIATLVLGIYGLYSAASSVILYICTILFTMCYNLIYYL